MAYQRYINAVPYSKGASLASVLGSLFEDLRVKEQEKQAILAKEDERFANLREQYMRSKEQPLEVFRPFGKVSEKEQAEIEKIKAETSEIRSKTARNVWDRSWSEKEEGLKHELRKSELANEYLKLQKIKSEIELQDKLNRLNAKYQGGAPEDAEGFMELIKYYSEIEKDLIAKRENYRNDGDDDLYLKATDRLKKLREKVAWLQDNHPYGYLVREMMPPEEVAEEKPKKGVLQSILDWPPGIKVAQPGAKLYEELKPGGPLRQSLKGWAKEKIEGPQVNELTPEAKAEMPEIPKDWKFIRYYGAKRKFQDEKVLDFMTWYVNNNKWDKRAMRKYQSLRNDPDFKWYFGEK